MGYDKCYTCEKVKNVKKDCEHWVCKKCKPDVVVNSVCRYCEYERRVLIIRKQYSNVLRTVVLNPE